MKRFLSLLLILLVLGTSSAMADRTIEGITYTDTSSAEIKVCYTLKGEGISPAETFTLVESENGSRQVQGNPDAVAPPLGTITGATFAEGAATAEGAEGKITIQLPEIGGENGFQETGVYIYRFWMTDNHNAGVAYYKDYIYLYVTVLSDDSEPGKLRIAGVHTEKDGGVKSGEIDISYSANTLNISKTVEGVLADTNKYFKFDLWMSTYSASEDYIYPDSYTVTGGSHADNPTSLSVTNGEINESFYLKHGDTIQIKNLPKGMSYTVTEDSTVSAGYDVKCGHGNRANGKMGSNPVDAHFVNTKVGEIDTGIRLDVLPYALILTFILFAGATMLLRHKRKI